MRLVKTVSAILTFLIVAVAAIPYMAVMSVVSEMDCYVSGCALNNNDGDTYQFTSWTNSGTTTFNGNTIPGSIYGTVNDGHVTFTGVNMGIVKLTSLDTTTPGSTVITGINPLASYGTIAQVGVPAGWMGPGSRGYCNSNLSPVACDDGWKTFGPVSFTVAGTNWQAVSVFRQEGCCNFVGHDSTFIFSKDNWAHACNPATMIANSFDCPANTTTADGDAPTAPGVSNTMLFPDLSPWDGSTAVARFTPIQYCQAQSINCPGVDNSGTYLYFFAGAGDFTKLYILRVTPANFLHGDPSLWQGYTCSGYTPASVCNGMDDTKWTATRSNWTSILEPTSTIGSQITNGFASSGDNRKVNWVGYPSGAMYLPNFESYMFMSAQSYITDQPGIAQASAPKPWGPWTRQVVVPYSTPANPPQTVFAKAFNTPLLFTYSATATDPPTGQFVYASNTYGSGHPASGSPFFNTATLGAGGPTRALVGGSKWRFASSLTSSSLPLKGLVLAHDFYDHGGDIKQPGFASNDLFGRALCLPCLAGGSYCGSQSPGNNLVWTQYGMTVDTVTAGGTCELRDMRPSTPTAMNAPACLTGDADWSIVVVANGDTNAVGTGANGSSNQAFVQLGSPAQLYNDNNNYNFLSFGYNMRATMGNNGDASVGVIWDKSGVQNFGATTASSTVIVGNWYMFTATKKAGLVSVGSTSSTLHIYRGTTELPLSLVHTASTPSTSAAQLKYFVNTSGGRPSAGMQLATGLIFDRILTQPELLHIYRYLQPQLAKRGITLQ